MANHRGSSGHRPLTDSEKGGFYRRLARMRADLREAIRPVVAALGGKPYARPGDPGNDIATVQAITVAMKILEAMRTEAVYEADARGAGYPTSGRRPGFPGRRRACSGPARSTRRGCPPLSAGGLPGEGSAFLAGRRLR